MDIEPLVEVAIGDLSGRFRQPGDRTGDRARYDDERGKEQQHPDGPEREQLHLESKRARPHLCLRINDRE